MKTKLCGWAGCNHITTGKYYCPKHQAIAEQKKAERDAKRIPFANAQRSSDYRSPEWRRLSAQLINEQGRCERCGSSMNLQVHHIIPVRYAPELYLDRSNLMVLCRECHQAETRREIKARKR